MRRICALLLSLPVRGAWIEIDNLRKGHRKLWSLPVRGAWIEIGHTGGNGNCTTVAPRTGSVD